MGFKDLVVSKDKLKMELPFEQLAMSQELKLFLDLFLLMPIEDLTSGLAAVSLDKQRKLRLHINLKEFNKFPLTEQLYILLHEGAHVLLGHLIRCTRIESQQVWNVATDAVLNSILNRHYQRLAKMPHNEEGDEIGLTLKSLQKDGVLNIEALNISENEITSEEVYALIYQNIEKTQALVSSQDKMRIDTHDPTFTADELSDEVKENIAEIMHAAANNNAYGETAGAFTKELMRVVKKSFPFREILDKIIYKNKPDFGRAHRRIHSPGVVFPRKLGEKIKVWAAVDVSGSCFDYIEDFAGYLLALPEIEEIYFFDTDITLTLHKGDVIPKVIPGWGGTDLNPVMKKFAEVEKDSAGVKCNFVVLTDGEIPTLTAGPIRSRTVIMTTNNDVQYSGTTNPYININISSSMKGGG